MKNSIVVDGVECFREQPEVTKNQAYVERYDWLKTRIEEELHNAQDLYDNMKEEELKFGTVEAEGYLRCAKFFANTLKMIEEEIPT